MGLIKWQLCSCLLEKALKQKEKAWFHKPPGETSSECGDKMRRKETWFHNPSNNHFAICYIIHFKPSKNISYIQLLLYLKSHSTGENKWIIYESTNFSFPNLGFSSLFPHCQSWRESSTWADLWKPYGFPTFSSRILSSKNTKTWNL